MGRGRSKVGVAKASEIAKVIIARMVAEENQMGCVEVDGSGWTDVEKVCGGV